MNPIVKWWEEDRVQHMIESCKLMKSPQYINVPCISLLVQSLDPQMYNFKFLPSRPKKYTHVHSTNITQVTTHTHTYKKSINCRTRNCNNSFEKKMTTTRGFYLWFSEFRVFFLVVWLKKGLVLIDCLWKKINSWLSFLSLFILKKFFKLITQKKVRQILRKG